MSNDYDALAPVYDILEIGNFAEALTPMLVDYALRHEWMGRRIMSVGCGTGKGLSWLAQHGYLLTAVDQSEAMLTVAKENLKSSRGTIDWHQQNILKLEGIDNMDMVLALNVMGELNTLKELETAFQAIRRTLHNERLFIFDIYTIEGLVIRQQSGDQLLQDQDNLTVFATNHYDYERQIQARHYRIYHQQSDQQWQRVDAKRTLRSYPIQAVLALVKRAKFEVATVLTHDLQPYDPGKAHTERVIILAKST
ncbi:class I SAM-dependent methyltransferase [Phototrophicus methaneseepsis]|uniref:Class I SAM-dependent methyltransferase n=1 Tax=Phototrophicus methaneseepsis TaxID=2710758 RepID=A0A7S8IDN7_9CHLR|nr:class I SAM-dependent methyltransferase [Phototrophicus methaneseepsis]QPC81539.1 class I SAM-dependent methyltransferase [Phototrophicus methaneseepsis]